MSVETQSLDTEGSASSFDECGDIGGEASDSVGVRISRIGGSAPISIICEPRSVSASPKPSDDGGSEENCGPLPDAVGNSAADTNKTDPIGPTLH